ncbi:amidase domain-containing protein [Guggenheimella bovis]
MFKKKLFIALFSIMIVFSLGKLAFTESNSKPEEKIKAVIEQFYDLSYESTIDLEIKDMSLVLDDESKFGKNLIVYIKEGIAENAYTLEKGYADIPRKRLPLILSFEKIAVHGETAIVWLKVDGDKDGGYPFFISLGDNTVTLKESGGKWIIESIKADNNVLMKLLNESEFKASELSDIQKQVDIEYGVDEKSYKESRYVPYDDYAYSATRSVAYADQFVTNRNTFFYDAGADCTNFVSQCVSYGFGTTNSYSLPTSYRMVLGTWSAGSGGGLPAWETVGSHWNYMFMNKTGQEGPRVSDRTWETLSDGGIMQIDFNKDGIYDHSAICVSKNLGKFAQHSSNRYNFYSKYIGQKRFYQPLFFRKY